MAHTNGQEYPAKLRNKIIMPFLGLTLFVAFIGTLITFFLEATNAQEKFNKDLAEKSRSVNYAVVDQERANLQFLIEVVYAPDNPITGAPAVAEAMRFNDEVGLYNAITPYFLNGMDRNTVQLDRLIAFNTQGIPLVDLERPDAGIEADYIIHQEQLDLSFLWEYVRDVLSTETDELGDKYAGMHLQLVDSTRGSIKNYFATIAPVKVTETEGDTQQEVLVGGIIVAMEIPQLNQMLLRNSQADIIVFYDQNGSPLISNIQPEDGLETLAMDPETREELVEMQAKNSSSDAESGAVFDVKTIEGVEYQFSYTELRIRRSSAGYVATALSRQNLMEEWSSTRWVLFGAFLILTVGVIFVGIVSSRMITAPVDELVTTARAVTVGHYDRRSNVRSDDEIGLLSDSFNHMTESLVGLLWQISAESGQRAAIVESIADGIIVCDTNGAIHLMNRASFHLLGLDESSIMPGSMQDIPLMPMEEAIFGSQQKDIYQLGDYIVRVTASAVTSTKGVYLGLVYVLQDLTKEVEIDRAKTGFIATISHELRTPLTSMRGNLDMLIHGIAGPLNDEQLPMVKTIGLQTKGIVDLVNNMILVAGLDSGSTNFEMEPIKLKPVIDKALWPLRKNFKAKKLSVKLDIPGDLPEVQADPIQLRTVMQQLMKNAEVYTNDGGVTVTAVQQDDIVQIDVIDTGCGIEEDFVEKVFDRFVRGKDDASNDRPDRGIGLGLAIVKDIIERHGGKVWATSVLGEGTTVSFTLPIIEIEEEEPEPEQSEMTEIAA